MLNETGNTQETITQGWRQVSEDQSHLLSYLDEQNTSKPLTREVILGSLNLSQYRSSVINKDKVIDKVFSGCYDGISIKEIDTMLIQSAAALITEDPAYSGLAANLLTNQIDLELTKHQITSFSASIQYGRSLGLIGDRLNSFVTKHQAQLDKRIVADRNDLFEFFGLRTLTDRYFLRHPQGRHVIESAQYFFMRIACALSQSLEEALDLYNIFSNLDYLPSSPTLFNAGTKHEQLSSCFLLDSPKDELEDIYKKYTDIALLSKFSGGIGLAYHRVRSNGSLIKSTNGHSNGIVPWLKTLDSSVSAVNQGGRRKGACCVYLESWHADIEDFLDMRENTGDESRRTHNLNIANWISDIFMRRVESNETWSLFDPADVPHFTDLYGEDFEKAYVKAEKSGLAKSSVKARDLYGRMMKTLAQTGNGWMTFKDSSNIKCNQTAKPGNVVHLSNLCTEIVEVTSGEESAVCNLGSINLSNHVCDNTFDFNKLAKTVTTAVRQLNRVIDINFYPIPSTKSSNSKWRPVGLGMMGLQDVFFKLGLEFDSSEALELSTQISEEIYFHALKTSCALAVEEGPHPSFDDTRAAVGDLQFDLWGISKGESKRWIELKDEIKKNGLRNSLLIAVAPTATIASIAGCYECIEPLTSNLFKRETLSGEFLQINKYLVAHLKKIGIWNAHTREQLKANEGSIQNIDLVPDHLKKLYRTAWELPMKAIIDLAASRGAYIDQSQSLNLFSESPNIGRLSSMYFYAWKKGLKSTYYLRSRPATKINKTTVTGTDAVSCSLENPESCEACQ